MHRTVNNVHNKDPDDKDAQTLEDINEIRTLILISVLFYLDAPL